MRGRDHCFLGDGSSIAEIDVRRSSVMLMVSLGYGGIECDCGVGYRMSADPMSFVFLENYKILKGMSIDETGQTDGEVMRLLLSIGDFR